MDSRLIAGAYSQHFRTVEKDDLQDSDRLDSIARAKKLSQETNKRRKVQAHKRKLEVQKEERRRQEILIKRREEQNQATEKYQRSHIPSSARPHSGRISPRRFGGPALDDALRLIRGSPRHDRHKLCRERSQSPSNRKEDPLERSYFDKGRQHHSSRPGSGRAAHLDSTVQAELMDHSMKNLTSSRSLFEQQLEQQQNFLKEQQEKSLAEFNNAVQEEINADQREQDDAQLEEGDEIEERGDMDSDSCSSVDSLERSGDRNNNQTFMQQNQIYGRSVVQGQLRPTSAHNSGIRKDGGQNNVQPFYLNGPNASDLQSQERDQNDSMKNSIVQQNHQPLNQDMTPSAMYQKEPTLLGEMKEGIDSLNHNKLSGNPYVGLTRADLLRDHTVKADAHENVYSQGIVGQNMKSTVKQLSSDSLAESGSSSSSISTIKAPNDRGVPTSATRSAIPTGQIGSGSGSGLETQTHSFSNQIPTTETVTNAPQAWVSPSPQSNSATPTQTPTPTRDDQFMENFHPRYASVIGSSIWPGSGYKQQTHTSTGAPLMAHNTHPYSTRGTLTSATTTTAFTAAEAPKSTLSLNVMVTTGTTSIMSETLTVQGMSSITNTMSNSVAVTNDKYSNNFKSFNKQDLTYPLSQNQEKESHSYSQYGTGSTVPSIQQSHLPISDAAISANLQREIEIMSQQALQQHGYLRGTNGQIFQQGASSVQQHTTTISPQEQLQNPLSQHQQQLKQTGIMPVPSVRPVFPSYRTPHTQSSGVTPNKNKNATNAEGTVSQTGVSNGNDNVASGSKNIIVNEPVQGEEQEEEDAVEEAEDMKPLKGILKQQPSKDQQSQPNSVPGKVVLRDSLELTRLQSEKKAKKKSVRFAEGHQLEETNEDVEAVEKTGAKGMVVVNSGVPSYRQAISKQAAVKGNATTTQPDTSKGQRAASAGTTRQVPPQTQVKVNSIVSSENANSANVRSNLPPSYTNSLNTSTPINRPKAAAHIIMSTDAQTAHKTGAVVTAYSGSSGAAASTAHKSHFEAKVKAVNNNFMSKVPVKVQNGSNNAVVYHMSGAGEGGNMELTESSAREVTSHYVQQNGDRSRIRDTSMKKVPISNSTVTRTSIVPASTKITLPSGNSAAPSYSTSTSQGSKAAVFDENGMRIDRTPTDEEISWLWDKVRNCLNKEDEKGGNKVVGGIHNDQGLRQPPTLSTKLIDGAALGFGTSSTANASRNGGTVFYPRTGNGNSSANKVKPALQQQGSYLRRYGLLQQRRVHSASAHGSGTGNTPVIQRASSATYGRHPTIQPPVSQQEPPTPTPMALGYKPQDNVSESTAAFLMAERLARQSLSDSHIHMAMEDAQKKQESHNQARVVNKGGPSALSMEEQRLLESLDKLNERLKVSDQKYPGTIHFHQPYQPHLPGFRGHQGMVDHRQYTPNVLSPRSQQRAQSARIRQQTRQYR